MKAPKKAKKEPKAAPGEGPPKSKKLTKAMTNKLQKKIDQSKKLIESASASVTASGSWDKIPSEAVDRVKLAVAAAEASCGVCEMVLETGLQDQLAEAEADFDEMHNALREATTLLEAFVTCYQTEGTQAANGTAADDI